METEFNHQEIARKLAKTMAAKAMRRNLEGCTKKQCFNNSSQWKKTNYLIFYGMDNQSQTLRF